MFHMKQTLQTASLFNFFLSVTLHSYFKRTNLDQVQMEITKLCIFLQIFQLHFFQLHCTYRIVICCVNRIVQISIQETIIPNVQDQSNSTFHVTFETAKKKKKKKKEKKKKFQRFDDDANETDVYTAAFAIGSISPFAVASRSFSDSNQPSTSQAPCT